MAFPFRRYAILSCVALGIFAAVMVYRQRTKIPDEEAVRMRAQAYWQAQKHEDIDKLYNFISPASKQVLSKIAFIRRFGGRIKYLSTAIKAIHCIDAKKASNGIATCQVKLYVRFQTGQKAVGIGGTMLNETWVKEDGQWWIAGH